MLQYSSFNLSKAIWCTGTHIQSLVDYNVSSLLLLWLKHGGPDVL